jgi:hypothetical protein
MEQKKIEQVKIKIDTQAAPVKPVQQMKQIAPPRDEKIKKFFDEK